MWRLACMEMNLTTSLHGRFDARQYSTAYSTVSAATNLLSLLGVAEPRRRHAMPPQGGLSRGTSGGRRWEGAPYSHTRPPPGGERGTVTARGDVSAEDSRRSQAAHLAALGLAVSQDELRR